jgi:hypothetical protein
VDDRPRRIMHCYETMGRKQGKPRLDRLGPRVAAAHDANQLAGSMAAEQPPDQGHAPRRSDDDDAGYHLAALESQDAVHQNRFAGERYELLVPAVAVSLSGSDNQTVVGRRPG